MSVTLEQARVIIAATRAKGREMGLKPLSVVVLDAGGHVVAFEREDGAPVGRFALAQGKAYGAVMMGMAGRAQLALAAARPAFAGALIGVYDGKFIPVPGGVLLRDAAGAIIGAIGITGDTSENDAEAGLAGAAAAGIAAEA
ncbi:heme-binding protein [Pararhodobacter sp.]|uniref:GlcG/HbpS family heme-binding protein n=1 Tax=Pararhodobacter sp. TaxID=2127056 RepID=UPI002AFFBAC6|nr:heme-binding protein [Pararhodobacter sp.]